MTIALTPGGRDLLQRALAGTADIRFTKLQLGSGANAGSSASALTTPKLSFAIESIEQEDLCVALTGTYNNHDVTAGFRCTEFGVWAEDPDDSTAEILYAYGYTPSASADYVPANSDTTLETEVRVLVYVGEAASVTAVIESGVYATKAELNAHKEDTENPHRVTYTQAGAAAASHTHAADDINSGILPVERGGTGNGTGYVTAGQKNGTTLGSGATAEGAETTASGPNSHAEGYGTTASQGSAHAEGSTTAASGAASHAEGSGTTASGMCSHAEGSGTIASGNYSHAEGSGCRALGDYQHVFGKHNVADTSYVEIVGWGTSSTRKNIRTLDQNGNEVLAGKLTLGAGPTNDMDAATKGYVDGHYVTAGQKSGTTLGDEATAEGHNAEASGDYSHAEGYISSASGESAHAEGGWATASGNYSHAEGSGSTASDESSHAEGEGTTASGAYSHSEGEGTTASGMSSHAEGDGSVASGSCSHAEGDGTIANHYSQHVFGAYNVGDPSVSASTLNGNYIEIVGNGDHDNARSNARTLDWDGNQWNAGKITVGAGPTADMDLATKKYVDDAIAAAIAALNS